MSGSKGRKQVADFFLDFLGRRYGLGDFRLEDFAIAGAQTVDRGESLSCAESTTDQCVLGNACGATGEVVELDSVIVSSQVTRNVAVVTDFLAATVFSADVFGRNQGQIW